MPRKKYYFVFVVNLIVCWIAYGIYAVGVHFSTDDYYALYMQRETAYDVIGMSYRNILGVLYLVLNKMGVNVVFQQQYFCAFCIIIMAISATVLTYIVFNVIKNKSNISMILINIGSVVLFVNVFASEWMWYSLAYLQWIIAISGMVSAVYFLSQKDNLNRNFVMASIGLFVAAGAYQSILAQYAFCIMCIIFIQNEWRITKYTVVSVIRAVLAALLGVATNIICTCLFDVIGLIEQESRVKKAGETFAVLLNNFINSLIVVWKSSLGLLKEHVMLIIVAVLLATVVYIFISSKCRVDTWIFVFLILISGNCVIFVSQLMQKSVWMPARMCVSVFAIFTVLLWIIADSDLLKIKYFISAVLMFFIFINIVCVQREAIDTYKTNELDRQYAQMINERIHEYESESGCFVSKIGICMDKYPTPKYYEIVNGAYSGEMQLRSFYTEWSSVYSFEYYMDRELEEVEIPYRYRSAFTENNWNSLDVDEQLIFDGDAVYICLY